MKVTKKQLLKIINEVLDEGENPCWDGYRPGARSGRKTKIGKSGKRVANCERISETGRLKEQDYYAAEDERAKSAVDDLPKLVKAIELNKRQADSTGGDMADMYENDAYQLQHIHDMSKDDLDKMQPPSTSLRNYMSRIDTAVREQIPLNLYNWIVGQE